MALNLNPKIFAKLHDTPQKSAIFIGIGTLILVLALFVFAIVPAVSSVIRQYEKNKRRTELVELQERKIDNLNKLVQAEEAHGEEIALLNENYPTFVDSEYILQNLQNYLEQNIGVKFTSIRVDELTPEQVASFAQGGGEDFNRYTIQSIKIGVTYYCTIEGGVKFLRYLESYPSILSIVDTSYTYIETENEESGVSRDGLPMNCNTNLSYYTKVEKAATPVPVATKP